MATASSSTNSTLARTDRIVRARAAVRPFQASSPVNVKGIAEQLGLKVWELKDMPGDKSGTIFKDAKNGGKSGYSIGVNARESYRRKRFTIAHEIGHFLLHRDLIGEGLTDDAMYRSGLSTQEETDANKLAADILMPFHLINQLVSAGIKDIKDLAEKLEVSEAAMRIRLGIPVVY